MKLTVPNGDLSVPAGLSLEVEQNSAFFSDDGAASLAVTLPATPANLALLDHPTRPARSTRYTNLFLATLSSGAFVKKGTLVVTSAARTGIECAVALEDSDFYTNFKEKNLRDIFAAKVLTTYDNPGDWYDYLYDIYVNAPVSSPFRVIPVAVSYNDEDGSYQVNNEPDQSAGKVTTYPLKHAARTVTEDGDEVGVPDGYGIAPFYLLHRFLSDLFTLCGYTVGKNCFANDSRLNSLLLLHATSDTICNGRLDCSDLVPSKTVAELLEWLRCKFHAQIVVHPGTATVDLVLLSDILQGDYDLDLTKRLLDNAVFSFEAPSHLVISPDTSLEGAAPAAATMEDLLEKYKCADPTLMQRGLVFDAARGNYYEMSAVGAGPYGMQTILKLVGTNYFTYDRKNADNAEALTWQDLTPPMVLVDGVLMPYVGERKHRGTTYQGSAHDEDQEIIIADYAGRSVYGTRWQQTRGNTYTRKNPGNIVTGLDSDTRWFYGTTQRCDNAGTERTGRYTLNGPEIFDTFFQDYNLLLRAGLTKLESRLDLSPGEILGYDLYALKAAAGQRLLPLSMHYVVGEHVRCQSAAFYLVKNYSDIKREQPDTIPAPSFKWEMDDSEYRTAAEEYRAGSGDPFAVERYVDDYVESSKAFFLIAPQSAGQTAALSRTVGFYHLDDRDTILATKTITIHFSSVAV